MKRRNDKIQREDKKDEMNTVFAVRGFDQKGAPYELILSAGDMESKTSWVKAISNEITRLKKVANMGKGLFQNSFVPFRLSHDARASSPNLRMVCSLISDLTVSMTPYFSWKTQIAG
jgi:hypothetical protein